MPNSVLIKSPSVITATRPKLVKHPLIRPGTKFLFDFTDPRCHPNGVITPGSGASVTGYTLTSLDPVPVTATIVGANATVNADGSIFLNGSNTYLKIGATGQFDMAPAPYEFFGSLWLKLPTSGYSTTAYTAMVKGGQNANNAQFYFDTGADGITPRAAIGRTSRGTGSDVAFSNGTKLTPGSVQQLGQYFKPATKISLIVNGVEISSATTPQADLKSNSTGSMSVGGGSFVATVYGVSLHDIDASLTAEATINAALTAAGKPNITARTYLQHATYDYQFNTGQLDAAPKTALA